MNIRLDLRNAEAYGSGLWYGWYGLVHLGDLGVKRHGGTTAGCLKNPQILGGALWSVSKLETNFSEQKIYVKIKLLPSKSRKSQG